MKSAAMVFFLVVSMTGIAHAGSIRVYNNDSKTHTVELKCNGSSKTLEIRSSTTATYTFHSTAKKCEITGGTVKWPGRTLEDGTKWNIKGGEAKSN